MKTITSYLVQYALAIIVLTIIFRFSLSYTLRQEYFIVATIIPFLYFFAMFFAGWFFGKKDGEYLPIYDVGFRFHLTTYLIFNGISEIWFLTDLNSVHEQIKTVHMTAAIWAFFLMIHLFFYLRARKNSIDDLNKTDLFE